MKIGTRFLFILFLCFLAGATQAAQKQVGQPCSSDNSSTDWDTIAQCNGTTFIKAPLILGAVANPPYSSTACDSGKAGMIQWTGTEFQGCDGSSWKTLGMNNGPNAFSFTNQTDADSSSTISSDAVTLSGFTGSLTAYCISGCTAIARNGTWGSVVVSGFVSGNTIAIRQTAGSSSTTTTSAAVVVGTTVSSAWSVTTDICGGAPTVGTVCGDGSVYVGLYPASSTKMYAARCDLGQTWSGSACTGTRNTYMWGTTSHVTGYTSATNGQSNTSGLVANYSTYNDGYTTGVPAAQACSDSTLHGKTDWYLPASDELAVVWTGAGSSSSGVTSAYSSSFDVSSSTKYYSSTEKDFENAYYYSYNNGTNGYNKKFNPYSVRCFRRN